MSKSAEWGPSSCELGVPQITKAREDRAGGFPRLSVSNFKSMLAADAANYLLSDRKVHTHG